MITKLGPKGGMETGHEYFQYSCMNGVIRVLRPPTFFHDARGEYVEIFNEAQFPGDAPRFVCDDISVSRKGALRGIHGDEKTWKLVTCLAGAFYLVVVCHDVTSKMYGQHAAFTLNAVNRLQVLIPPKWGNGHLALEDGTIFFYKQSQAYDRAGQFTLYWNNPALGIHWPMKPTIISARDDNPEARLNA